MIEQIGLILLAVSLNGFLTVDGNDYQITWLDDSKVITKGFAEYPFVCITKCYLFIDRELHEATYKDPLPVTVEPPRQKNSNLELVTASKATFTQWWDEFFIHANTRVQSDVNLKIYDSNNILLKDLNQKTNVNGYTAFSFLLDSKLPEGKYTYTITANDGIKILSDTDSFFVIVKDNSG